MGTCTTFHGVFVSGLILSVAITAFAQVDDQSAVIGTRGASLPERTIVLPRVHAPTVLWQDAAREQGHRLGVTSKDYRWLSAIGQRDAATAEQARSARRWRVLGLLDGLGIGLGVASVVFAYVTGDALWESQDPVGSRILGSAVLIGTVAGGVVGVHIGWRLGERATGQFGKAGLVALSPVAAVGWYGGAFTAVASLILIVYGDGINWHIY